jgi:hypothetical protein
MNILKGANDNINRFESSIHHEIPWNASHQFQLVLAFNKLGYVAWPKMISEPSGISRSDMQLLDRVTSTTFQRKPHNLKQYPGTSRMVRYRSGPCLILACQAVNALWQPSRRRELSRHPGRGPALLASSPINPIIGTFMSRASGRPSSRATRSLA